jgi:hypothetical protein
MSYFKVTRMGKYTEIKEYEKELAHLPYSPIKRRFGRRHSELRRYRPDNIGRKVTCFKNIVWSNLGGDESPALITFTMFEIGSIVSAYKSLTVCVQRLRKRLKNSFKYIAVPEFQRRGAVHFHMIIWGLPDYIIKNETPHWNREEDVGDLDKIQRGNRYLQNIWQRGFVDCLPTDGNPRLAGYLCKYLSKAMSDERLFSQKSYVCSRNVLHPVSVTSKETYGNANEIAGIDLSVAKLEIDTEYQTKWLGNCHKRLYKVD